MKILSQIKTIAAVVILFLASNSSFAQEASKNIPVQGFTEVSVSSGIDLYITQGTTESLNIRSTSNELLKDIVVEKEGNRITIKFKNNMSWNRMFKNQSIKAYLNYKTLNALRASGGSDVFTQNTLNSNTLSLSASGGADLKMALACKNLTVEISGGSDADLSGKTENLNARSSGGSDLNAFSLSAVNAKVSASGGSDAEVSVSAALEANASGGSDITYKGNPSVKKNSSASGDVRKAG
ncbi:MAG: DUF2807 domain-containing protein [Pedobacter sp.]|nr:MAG: DUF2807 domain-containing protein [Pedobacter sp.]